MINFQIVILTHNVSGDCIGRFKSNYNTIKATTGSPPHVIVSSKNYFFHRYNHHLILISKRGQILLLTLVIRCGGAGTKVFANCVWALGAENINYNILTDRTM